MDGIEFTLPCGVFDVKGVLHRKVFMRPWRAKVKRLLGKLNPRKDAAKAVYIILKETIVGIDGFSTLTDALLRNMTAPDREFCAVQARKLSRGNIVESDFSCSYCGYTRKDMKLDLDKMSIMAMEEFNEDPDLPTIEVEDKPDADGQPTGKKRFVFHLDINGPMYGSPDGMVRAKFRLPNGRDMEEIAKVAKKNPVEGDWILWSRTCLEWGDEPIPLRGPFWDNLTGAQLESLEDGFALLDRLGPETVNTIECDECERNNLVSVYSTDFLLRLPRSRT
jgi:hypothetical protein